MLRCGQKRRRTKAEIGEEKEEARIKQQSIEDKQAQLEALKEEQDLLKAQAANN